MYKYTIKAYSEFGTIGGLNAIQVTVQASNEDEAISRAKIIVKRDNYAVVAIEDMRGAEIKKIQG